MGHTTPTLRQTHDARIYRIALIGVMAAMAIMLMYVRFTPLPGAASFLKYDLGDIPILLLTLVAGPLPALGALLISTFIEMVTVSEAGIWGFLMHFLATGSMVLVLGAVTHRSVTTRRVIIGLILAALTLIAIMLPINVVVAPLFTPNLTAADVVKMFIPVFLPFNAFKGILHGIIVFILYKATAPAFARLTRHIAPRRAYQGDTHDTQPPRSR